jgi:geranylgeranylglycerol-phosphate geranylgeranyltransferase
MNSDVPPRGMLRSYVSLARPLNAGVTVASICAAGVIAGVGAGRWPVLLAAAVGGTLIGAAGNIINDVHDIAIDRINKPRRALASGAADPRRARRWADASSAVGLALSAPAGPFAFAIAVCAVLLLHAYSARLKRIPLLGNAVVGAVTGVAFLYGAAAAGNVVGGAVPAVFAFLFNVGREILKDVEDMPGDAAAGIQTWPLLRGPRTAMRTATAVFALLAALTPLPYLSGAFDAAYLALVLGTVVLPLCVMLGLLWRNRAWETRDGMLLLRRINLALKIDMLAGIAALLAGTR